MSYSKISKADWDKLVDLCIECANLIIEYEDTENIDIKIKLENIKLQIDKIDQLYPNNPIVLDTKSDFLENLEQKINLKIRAINLCDSEDYLLRGNIYKDLAEIFLDKRDYQQAKKHIKKAISNLELSKNMDDLNEANKINEEIYRASINFTEQ